MLKEKLTCFNDVIYSNFSPSYCSDRNILPFAFLEKLFDIEYCSMDVNQLSKYYKEAFQIHEDYGSSTLENGRSDNVRPNL